MDRLLRAENAPKPLLWDGMVTLDVFFGCGQGDLSTPPVACSVRDQQARDRATEDLSFTGELLSQIEILDS